MACRTDLFSGCRPKRSGRRPRAASTATSSPGATSSIKPGAIPAKEAKAAPPQWRPTPPAPARMGLWTWSATSGNGRILRGKPIPIERMMDARMRTLPDIASIAAARGAAIVTAHVVPPATGTDPITSSTASVFVWCAPHPSLHSDALRSESLTRFFTLAKVPEPSQGFTRQAPTLSDSSLPCLRLPLPQSFCKPVKIRNCLVQANEKVVVVGHQAIGDKRERVFLQLCFDFSKQEMIVFIVGNYVSPVHPAIEHKVVISRSMLHTYNLAKVLNLRKVIIIRYAIKPTDPIFRPCNHRSKNASTCS